MGFLGGGGPPSTDRLVYFIDFNHDTMREIDFFNMPRDIAALGKETRRVMQNLDGDKANSVIRVLAFKCGFEKKEG